MAMTTPEEQLGKILALLGENSKGIKELKASMTEMRDLKTELYNWKPVVDQRVHDLEHTVLDLSERIDQVLDVINPSSPRQEYTAPITTSIREDHFASPSKQVLNSARLEFSPSRAAPGSLDHSKLGYGVVLTTAPTQPSGTGAKSLHTKVSPLHTEYPEQPDPYYYHYPMYSTATPFPEVEFHKFDGTNPKLWIKRCETYFDVYQTDPSLWVRLASMRMTGSAALWFQTLSNPTTTMTWETFVLYDDDDDSNSKSM